jgi:hypothetical protein
VQFLSDDPQEPQVQCSEDPQGSFSPLRHFFFVIFQWSSYLMIPKTPKMSQGGSSINIFDILTLVCHSWMQFWSEVLQRPHLQPSKEPQRSFWHFFTFFQWIPYLMIHKKPQIQSSEYPQGSFSPFWHFFANFECNS